MVQVPLYKQLVSMESIATTRLEAELSNGDVINVPRFASLSAVTYTPGTEISATPQDWSKDQLIVSTYKVVSIYVDDVRKLTLNIDQQTELMGEMAFQLSNKIDQFVFGKISHLKGSPTLGYKAADALDLQGGSDHRPISAGSANIINIFANARKVLRRENVEETVRWVAVVSPTIASYIEIKAANSGFTVADSTLRNGYAGDFMGFDVFISRNLPSGSCSTIAVPTATFEGSTVNWGGLSGTAVSATDCRNIYFGQEKTMDLVMLAAPTVRVQPVSDMLGHNVQVYTLYGAALMEKNRKRGIIVPLDITFNSGVQND